TKNPDAERRIWAYPQPDVEIMRDAYRLRYALIHYISAASREAYETGMSLCRPMYYDYPEATEAYEFKDQYMFGDDLLVSPVTQAVAAESQLATRSVWLAPGEWIEWSSGARLRGPARVERTFAIDEWPVYVRGGAIIPMQRNVEHKLGQAGDAHLNPLVLDVFPGASGKTRVYEDAGDTLGYKTNQFAWTTIS